MPSLYEGFSLPAVEAMACATPLVASHGRRASRRSSGPTALCADLVPPGDAGELVQRDRSSCSTTPTPGRGWATPGGSGRLTEFTWRAVAEADRRGLPRTSIDVHEEKPMLTVDFDRLGLRPG